MVGESDESGTLSGKDSGSFPAERFKKHAALMEDINKMSKAKMCEVARQLAGNEGYFLFNDEGQWQACNLEEYNSQIEKWSKTRGQGMYLRLHLNYALSQIICKKQEDRTSEENKAMSEATRISDRKTSVGASEFSRGEDSFDEEEKSGLSSDLRADFVKNNENVVQILALLKAQACAKQVLEDTDNDSSERGEHSEAVLKAARTAEKAAAVINDLSNQICDVKLGKQYEVRLEKNLPKFSGAKHEKVDDWIFQIDLFQERMNVRNENMLKLVTPLLRDDALELVKKQRRERKELDWVGFKKELIERYKPLDLQRKLRADLWRLKQVAGVEEFVHKFQALYNKMENYL